MNTDSTKHTLSFIWPVLLFLVSLLVVGGYHAYQARVNTEFRICTVKTVHVCVSNNHGTDCRVDCTSGLRLTTKTLVAPGDKVEYLSYKKGYPK